MLIVVEYRNVQLFCQRLFDLETVWRSYVFQVDAAKGGRDTHHGIDELAGMRRVHLDIEHVDTCKVFEKHALAFHHRLPGKRAGVTQPQYSSTIGDNRHQVALGGVPVGILGIFCNAPDRLRHTRRIGQRQVPLGSRRLGQLYADFSRYGIFMIFQCGLVDICISIFTHGLPLDGNNWPGFKASRPKTHRTAIPGSLRHTFHPWNKKAPRGRPLAGTGCSAQRA